MGRAVTSYDAPAMTQPSDLPRLERVGIHFSWVLKLRWLAAAGQLVTVLFAVFGLGLDLPLAVLCGIVALEGLTNVVLAGWGRAARARAGRDTAARRLEAALGGVMLGDVVLLTLLLYLTGGPENPFSVFYLVNIVLGAMVLPPVWSAMLVGLALAGWASLFLYHVPVPALEDPSAEGPGGIGLATFGRLVAFPSAAVVIAVFVARLNAERAALERKLEEERRKRERSAKLEALGTLAAGAAHELASPLSTIAVAAKDLELELLRTRPESESVEDARLIRQEVARCREILEGMAADAGQIQGGDLGRLMVDEIVDATLANLRGRDRVVVRVEESARGAALEAPRRALPLALRQIVKNALDHGASGGPVTFSVRRESGGVVFEVHDRGPGMDAPTLDRAEEPFFTTKETGRGLGLGLFLTRTVVERLGGALELRSRPGEGTRAVVRVPLPD